MRPDRMPWLPGLAVFALPVVLASTAGEAPSSPRRNLPVVADVDVDAECRALYGRGFSPLTSRAARPAPHRERPAKGEVFRDPLAGTCVVRATDHAQEPPTGFARNDYSRRQAFNADATRFIVQARGGAWHLYDANSLRWLRQLQGPHGDAEPQWDPRDPRTLLFLPDKGGLQLSRLDVEANRARVVARFEGRLPWPGATRVWTRGEGSPSADGRYWCFLAQSDDGRTLGAFSYDLREDAVIASHALDTSPDSISASPSGRWCVVSGERKDGGTVAWSRDFKRSRKLYEDSEHSDIARSSDGSDVYVWIDQQGDGQLLMVDLDSGRRTPLLSTWIAGSASSVHVSGKAFDRPGWVLVSTFNRKGGSSWLQEQLLAVQLRPDPRVVRLGFHHARYKTYWSQPQATGDRDFGHVLFNSNWDGDKPDDVDAYLIRLPKGFPDAD